MMKIPTAIMNMPFNNPELIPEVEIGKLAAAFRHYSEIDSIIVGPVSNASKRNLKISLRH